MMFQIIVAVIALFLMFMTAREIYGFMHECDL